MKNHTDDCTVVETGKCNCDQTERILELLEMNRRLITQVIRYRSAYQLVQGMTPKEER